jgi:hypothetical protein
VFILYALLVRQLAHQELGWFWREECRSIRRNSFQEVYYSPFGLAAAAAFYLKCSLQLFG